MAEARARARERGAAEGTVSDAGSEARAGARGGAAPGLARAEAWRGCERTILAVIMSRNSSKSIEPEPSLSMSPIIW